MPSGSPVSKLCTRETLRHIQYVIKNTSTPSWVNSVSNNYGEPSAGSIKADEWRTLATIYLPIALVTLWGYTNGLPSTSESSFLWALGHTMALFQAVTLVYCNTMNKDHALKYQTLLQKWVSGLHEIHPHMKNHKARTNVHAAMHLYDFILLYGPVMSWWCFPFERLIGTLQKINTNDLVGGKPLSVWPTCFGLRYRFRSSGADHSTGTYEGCQYPVVVEQRGLSCSYSPVQASL